MLREGGFQFPEVFSCSDSKSEAFSKFPAKKISLEITGEAAKVDGTYCIEQYRDQTPVWCTTSSGKWNAKMEVKPPMKTIYFRSREATILTGIQ